MAVHGDWGVEVARKSFDVRPGGAVEIEVEDSDVILESTTSSTIEVILYIDADETFAKELFQDMEFDAALENNIVRVEARDGGADFDSWDDHANVVTVVRFPRTSDVSVRTSDGDILAGEIEGDVTLLSSDGDIVLDGVMEGELEVRTSDGDIVIDLIEAASARIGTSDGDILLGRVDSPLSVSSGDGDVQVSLARAHETQISTGDGDILLTAPESLSAELLIDA